MDSETSLEITHSPIPIQWEMGTAYDLFFSLFVLHRPDRFGLRASWAAGVRSRLPVEHRKTLEEAQDVIQMPLRWLHVLPPPKDGRSILQALQALPGQERVYRLGRRANHDPQVEIILQRVYANGKWDEADREQLRSAYSQQKLVSREGPPKYQDIANILNAWASADAFGERYLAALQVYYEVFFHEEEQRIRPFLQAAIAESQALAADLLPPALIEHLSRGLILPFLSRLQQLTLVPSFWMSPLVVYDWLSPEHLMFVFGARPDEAVLIPGETVPDAMLQSLKAMADPTRLRILRYLSEEAHTPSRLARLLRLRAPTVIHHLDALRLAGLVHLALDANGERRYVIREEAVEKTWDTLQSFLRTKGDA